MNALSAAILAARELDWQPHHNLMPRRLAERHAAHDRLIDRLHDLEPLPASAAPEVACLVEAMHRIAQCSFANRMGFRYYERKQAFAELRGCLIVYDRAVAT